MEFTSDRKVLAVRGLVEALFQHVLYDEDPVWFGDEATILDVSLVEPEELLKRCSDYYKTAVSLDQLHKPLWQLLPELEGRRKAAS